ncbi:zinc ribbon domain-containing protein [Lactobacillus sp. 23-2]|uniref:zinc ribbon domain-containing protein n=1 Tax=Lactobacillus sp. 23-2 TaxID=2981842 RepID=UPI0038335C85
MNKCPNCSQPVTDQDAYCRTCGFNLAKYRRDYFTGEEPEAASNDSLQETQETKQAAPQSSWLDDEEAKPAEPAEPTEPPKRELTRRSYQSQERAEKSKSAVNATAERMFQWMRENTTIAFCVGVALLVIMSFSREIGWTAFAVSMIALWWVCRNKEVSQYEADKNLTDEFKQTTSKVFDSFDDRESELEEKKQHFASKHPKVHVKVEQHKTKLKPAKKARKHDFGWVQIAAVMTAAIALILLFAGYGFTAGSGSRMTIASVFFETGNALMQSGQYVPAAIIYAVLAAWIILPIFTLLAIVQNTKGSRVKAFFLSLLETVLVIYVTYHLPAGRVVNTQFIYSVFSGLHSYAVALNASAWLLIFDSLLTTGLTGYSMFEPLAQKQRAKKQEQAEKKDQEPEE